MGITVGNAAVNQLLDAFYTWNALQGSGNQHVLQQQLMAANSSRVHTLVENVLGADVLLNLDFGAFKEVVDVPAGATKTVLQPLLPSPARLMASSLRLKPPQPLLGVQIVAAVVPPHSAVGKLAALGKLPLSLSAVVELVEQHGGGAPPKVLHAVETWASGVSVETEETDPAQPAQAAEGGASEGEKGGAGADVTCTWNEMFLVPLPVDVIPQMLHFLGGDGEGLGAASRAAAGG